MDKYTKNSLEQPTLIPSRKNAAIEEEDNDSDSNSDMPPKLIIDNNVSIAKLELLPRTSRLLYENQYKTFMKWCEENYVENFTEDAFVAYFSCKAANQKSSTLWSSYSMLKSTLAAKDNIDISKFDKLISLLKEHSVGYKPKKSKVFTRNQINEFVCNAPDDSYLMWKICLLIGVAGACRRDELCKMRVEDIVDIGNMLVITIPESAIGKKRVFTLTNEFCQGANLLELFRKYKVLRPDHCEHNRFFINYRLKKCSIQVVGIHTFARIPSLIAKYLHLPDERAYTGHCYRRTSISLAEYSGMDFVAPKRQRGRNPSAVFENSGETFENNFTIADAPQIETEMFDTTPAIKSEIVEEGSPETTSKSDTRETTNDSFDVPIEDQDEDMDYLDQNKDEDLLKLLTSERLTDPLQHQEQLNETDQFCKYLATQLRKVPQKKRSRIQLEFLQRVHDVLYEKENVQN